MKPRRQQNLIKRFLNGEEFYTNFSPRITHAEIKELDNLGLRLQCDHTHGAEAGPIAVYPLIKEEFEKRAKEILGETLSEEHPLTTSPSIDARGKKALIETMYDEATLNHRKAVQQHKPLAALKWKERLEFLDTRLAELGE